MSGNKGPSEERQIWSHVSKDTTTRSKLAKPYELLGLKIPRQHNHWQALRIWGKYIQNLYESENRPKDIPIEAEDELDEDDKGPTILKN